MSTAKVQAKMGLEDTRITNEPAEELPLPPSRRPYGPDDVIDGRYRLESLLGKGGMGEVWTARNDTLGVRRAIKLIRADSGGAENTDRLLHEARAAARLADPAIVRVFDFGRTNWGDPFIVMEMLEGEDLMSIINRRERLSPSKAVRVLLPLIRALGAAHENGIVHRDLKPENIFLAKLDDGRVQPKLLDFGIAKLKNARDLRLTSAGAVIGSPLYMAPEQARGEEVDERADIWALSVVLYEAIAGSLPFNGDDRAQVMHAAMTTEPKDLSEYGVSDGGLWPIVKRGLSRSRDDRWPNMLELGRALARWLLDSGVTDDITGASIEAGWFRTSRQSLFASSLPPDHRFGELERRVGVLLRRVRPLTRAGRAGWSSALSWWRGLAPSRRWAIGAVLLLGLGVMAARQSGQVSPTESPLAAAPAIERLNPTATPALPPEPSRAPAQSEIDVARAPDPEIPAAQPPPTPAATKRNLARTGSRPAAARARANGQRERRPQLVDPYQ
jgi:serine/threonine protein kinase